MTMPINDRMITKPMMNDYDLLFDGRWQQVGNKLHYKAKKGIEREAIDEYFKQHWALDNGKPDPHYQWAIFGTSEKGHLVMFWRQQCCSLCVGEDEDEDEETDDEDECDPENEDD
jgi:hypothetical protein